MRKLAAVFLYASVKAALKEKIHAGVYGAGGQTAGTQYTATPLVSGLRLRPYPAADDDNCNYAICYLEKGKSYPLVQTRNGWAFVLTEGTSGGWACISDDAGTYLSIEEV